MEEGQQQVCCDENIPCVPTNAEKNNISNNKKALFFIATTTDSLDTAHICI
ncbi:MAG TPA: hypothetical protein VLA74_01090 [Nitrososphaeraceae archaeon]|nr:hypothetical protein [Nitrososphaeraceae archaeon]